MIRTCLDPTWQAPEGWKEQPVDTEQDVQALGERAAARLNTPNPQLGDERMQRKWIHAAWAAVVSASAGRVVVSCMQPTADRIFAILMEQVGLDFLAYTDEPSWAWRRGSNMVAVAKETGMIPKDTDLPPMWIWHYLDPKAVPV